MTLPRASKSLGGVTPQSQLPKLDTFRLPLTKTFTESLVPSTESFVTGNNKTTKSQGLSPSWHPATVRCVGSIPTAGTLATRPVKKKGITMTKINATREIEWENPEPRRNGRGSAGKQYILDAVRNSPGRWAIWNKSCTHAVYYQCKIAYPEYNWEYNVQPNTAPSATRLYRVFVQFPLAKQGK